jgi:hypothetical protein
MHQVRLHRVVFNARSNIVREHRGIVFLFGGHREEGKQSSATRAFMACLSSPERVGPAHLGGDGWINATPAVYRRYRPASGHERWQRRRPTRHRGLRCDPLPNKA